LWSSSVLSLLLAVATFDFRLERGKRLVPELIEPAAQRAEPVRIDEIDPPRSVLSVSHKACVLERFEVLRHGRTTDRHPAGDRAHGSRSLPEALEHAPARGISQSREHISVSHDLP